MTESWSILLHLFLHHARENTTNQNIGQLLYIQWYYIHPSHHALCYVQGLYPFSETNFQDSEIQINPFTSKIFRIFILLTVSQTSHTYFSFKFKRFPEVLFQSRKMPQSNSRTFQVLQHAYKPCMLHWLCWQLYFLWCGINSFATLSCGLHVLTCHFHFLVYRLT